MIRARFAFLPLLAVVVAGCGGGGDSEVSASTRIDRCLDNQPEATKPECKSWEQDDQLADDGTHEGHDSM